jgi:hypothetical protein
MKIGTGVQAILGFCLRNLRGCNVDITDGRDFRIAALRWVRCLDIHTKFHKDLFSHSEVKRGIHLQTHRQQGDNMESRLKILI